MSRRHSSTKPPRPGIVGRRFEPVVFVLMLMVLFALIWLGVRA